MSLLIAITGWSPDFWRDAVLRQAPGRRVEMLPVIEDPSAVRYVLAWKPPGDVFARLPNLEAVFSLGAGVDHLMDHAVLPDVPIVRIVDPDLTMRMSEWVVLQVLMHHRRQRAYDAAQTARQWRPLRQWPASAVRVGVMGLGVLGRTAAEALAGLGFDVAGWSRTEKRLDGIATFHGDDGLDAFLRRTDVLVVLLPLTPHTRGMIDGELIGKLASDGPLGGPVLINAGRGGLQVEGDVVRALIDGPLAAASLDVFETEPLPTSSPLWTLPNVTVTPHVAAESDPEALIANVLAQIDAYERGKGLKHVVDRARGY